jgi:glucose/arabinose dehydrogenase
MLPAAPVYGAVQLDRLTLPGGFHIATYADQVPNARAIALGAKGAMFVGPIGAGKVYARTDAQHDRHADQVCLSASGLKMPVGVAFHHGDLVASHQSLTAGFEGSEPARGRPVDVRPLPDGSMLVDDDPAGAVYRATCGGRDSIASAGR